MSLVFSKLAFHFNDLTRPSVLTLIAANVVPLLGVLFLGWSTFAIVVIYWSENVVIGAINILKMIVCSPEANAIKLANTSPKQRKGNSQQVKELLAKQSPNIVIAHHASKLFFIPFFTFHYGMFCFVHGEFVFDLLGHYEVPFGPAESAQYMIKQLYNENLLWAVGALGISHLYSFFVNFMYRGEYRRVTVPQLMFQPYGRIVILHVAILLGAFLIVALGSRTWMLVVLIIGKTLLDIGLHLLQREQDAEKPEPAPVLTTI